MVNRVSFLRLLVLWCRGIKCSNYFSNAEKLQELKPPLGKDFKSDIANYTHDAKIAISDKKRNIT